MSSIWKGIISIMNIAIHLKRMLVNSKGITITDTRKIANLFNEYYPSVYSHIDK